MDAKEAACRAFQAEETHQQKLEGGSLAGPKQLEPSQQGRGGGDEVSEEAGDQTKVRMQISLCLIEKGSRRSLTRGDKSGSREISEENGKVIQVQQMVAWNGMWRKAGRFWT